MFTVEQTHVFRSSLHDSFYLFKNKCIVRSSAEHLPTGAVTVEREIILTFVWLSKASKLSHHRHFNRKKKQTQKEFQVNENGKRGRKNEKKQK